MATPTSKGVTPFVTLASRIKGTPAAILGRIEAPDAESAIKKWIETYEITNPDQQQRLVARLVK
jgi:hypothetical protein